jgi:hypothetical protein
VRADLGVSVRVGKAFELEAGDKRRERILERLGTLDHWIGVDTSCFDFRPDGLPEGVDS